MSSVRSCRSRRGLAPLWLFLALCGCDAGTDEARWLSLRQIRPENEFDVYLNERIVLHFSEPLDPSSVHPRSVRVVSSEGREARGRLGVDRDRIVFSPAPVLAHDLSDGGYLPGTTYFVELAGFPRPDGLRGASGAPLPRSLRWQFRTIDRDSGPAGLAASAASLAHSRAGPSASLPRFATAFALALGSRLARDPGAATGASERALFEDPSPERGSVVVMETAKLRPLQPIRLVCPEALDPSTLFSEDFSLKSRADPTIPLVARLLSNDEGGALIELRPRDRVLEPGSYQLQLSRNVRLRDLGRHPLLYDRSLSRPMRIEPGSTPDAGPPTQHIESFVDERTRSPEAVDGVDGTAYWGRSDDPEGRSGKVEVRWPAAAGLGIDGEVELGATLASTDLHSFRLRLPAAVTCELERASGPVVLRSQGRMHLSGTLRRSSGLAATAAQATVERLEALRRLGPRSTLSQFLEEIVREGLDVTVVVAGGDLQLDGRIVSDRPVVLVAGGKIRLGRSAALVVPRLYYRDGSRTKLAIETPSAALELDLDPPSTNTLAGVLRFAVKSSSIPPNGRAQRWLPAPQVHRHDGQGRALVRYVGEHESDDAQRRTDVLVDDPAALVDYCPTLRLSIELSVQPSDSWLPPFARTRWRSLLWGTWDPPWVDDVALQYEPEEPGKER